MKFVFEHRSRDVSTQTGNAATTVSNKVPSNAAMPTIGNSDDRRAVGCRERIGQSDCISDRRNIAVRAALADVEL